MRSSLECLPCLVRQAVDAVGLVVDDEIRRESVMRLVFRELSGMDFGQPPPVVAQGIHRLLRHVTGAEDPFRRSKDRFNAMALELLPAFERRVAESAYPFGAAVRLAIAGNVIDLGAKGNLTEDDAFSVVDRAFEEPVEGDVEEFQNAAFSAGSILYLADNAGEIVFDRILIGLLPAGRVTVAVRGRPVINDAVESDAAAAGLDRLAWVINNGSDAPGTVLRDCSQEFLECYRRADIVIAKGQGNYETLCDENRNIYFLFRVKCPIVASHSGFTAGTHALVRRREAGAVGT